MRLWTNTGLYYKGGAGGLLLDTGTTTSFLPLPSSILDQMSSSGNIEPGVTTFRLPSEVSAVSRSGLNDLPVKECDIEVCFVCKKCRVAFTGESPLLTHQRQCFGGNLEGRGAFRIVQIAYECKLCDSTEKYKSLIDFRKHCEGIESHHKYLKIGSGSCTSSSSVVASSSPIVASSTSVVASSCVVGSTGTLSGSSSTSSSTLPPPSESPLSHEMEDVVNQITLIAARTAQQNVPDQNSNNFCQPAEPKRRFMTQNDALASQQPLTSAGH